MELQLSTTGQPQRFALILSGGALAPRYRHGDVLAIDPSLQAQAGDAVLFSIPEQPDFRGIMFLNADGDLTDSRFGFRAAGRFAVLGVVFSSCRYADTTMNHETGTINVPLDDDPDGLPDYLQP